MFSHFPAISPETAPIFFSFYSEVASDLSHAFSIIDLATKKETALALSSLLQVPLIKLDSLDDDTPYKYVISMKPSYRVICRALKDIMEFYSFQQIAVVYDGKIFQNVGFKTNALLGWQQLLWCHRFANWSRV